MTLPGSSLDRRRIGRWLMGALSACLALLAWSTVFAQEADESVAKREEAALRAAAESVAGSVVQIRTIGGLDAAAGALPVDGPTSGLIISPDGCIVSSSFNFTQQPASILVTFASGKQAPAELVATDHSRMLVLLKVADAADLPVATFAPADDIRVGQWAVAIGRTFRADRTNLSVGIVSALGRMFGKALQTDADVSTANYGGPLVDIRGRVLGLIVPIAPQSAGQVAGAEWYDSGIGFAVPLAPLAEALERMKRGEDQYAGILGIGMVAKNPHTSPAELAAVRPDAPAGKAGLRKGDRIVEVDGQPIKTQTELRFALGPRYGGESVRVVAERGGERIERTIKLAGKLEAFRHAFLGILPMRPIGDSIAENDEDAGEDAVAESAAKEVNEGEKVEDEAKDESRDGAGVVVRMVYPGSPAAEAGIQAGDHVERINDAKIASTAEAIVEMNNVAPGGAVDVEVVRGDESLDLRLTAARLPTNVLEVLPAAHESARAITADEKEIAADEAGAKVNSSELKLAEFKQSCQIYVPESKDENRPLGLLLWLHAPGDADAEQVIRDWQAICDRDGVMLVVPTAAEGGQWERTDLEYLQKLTLQVLRQQKIDPHRVVVFGQQGGGTLAWLLGLSGRSVFRGVAVSVAPLPRQVKAPENEPSLRLAVFAGLPANEDDTVQIVRGLAELSDAGYPVTTVTLGDRDGLFSASEREELARWIDSLDRF